MKISKGDTVELISLNNVRTSWYRFNLSNENIGQRFEVKRKYTDYRGEAVQIRLKGTNTRTNMPDECTVDVPIKNVIKVNAKIYKIKDELTQNDASTQKTNTTDKNEEETKDANKSNNNTRS